MEDVPVEQNFMHDDHTNLCGKHLKRRFEKVYKLH